jgi:hypothetical protein
MKGLVFSEPMVRAWNEGRKTVTRRLINDSFPFDEVIGLGNIEEKISFLVRNKGIEAKWINPPYRPGETVYIKETWRVGGWRKGAVHLYFCGDASAHTKSAPAEFIKSLDEDERKWSGDDKKHDPFRKRSPRFMPEWAARSHALIVSVRPERIQEITVEEIIKEGFVTKLRDHDACCDLQSQFIGLWDSLHGAQNFHVINPWVWRIELEKTRRTA